MAIDTDENRPLLPFFLLTFILTLPGYALIYLCATGSILSPEMAQSFVPLAALAPVAAALILIARKHGKAGVKALLLPAFDFKRITNKLWQLAIFLVPIVIFLLVYIAATVTDQPLNPATFPLIAAPLALVLFLGGAASENLGWIGYAYMPIQARWNAFVATSRQLGRLNE